MSYLVETQTVGFLMQRFTYFDGDLTRAVSFLNGILFHQEMYKN